MNIIDLNTGIFFDPSERREFEKYLMEYSDTYFVAELEGKVVGGGGYCLLDDPGIAEISWTLFHPNYSRKGMGAELLKHCLGLLSKMQDINKIVVETSQLAFQFFEKFDFKLTHTQKDYWGKGLDLYYMEKLND